MSGKRSWPWIATAMVLCSCTFTALAFDEFEHLQGLQVIYAGELDAVDCPIGGKYDCATWPMTMLKTRKGPEICLAITKYVQCRYRCKGLIAVGDDKRPKAFIFSAMSSDANEFDFERYRCPDPF